MTAMMTRVTGTVSISIPATWRRIVGVAAGALQMAVLGVAFCIPCGVFAQGNVANPDLISTTSPSIDATMGTSRLESPGNSTVELKSVTGAEIGTSSSVSGSAGNAQHSATHTVQSTQPAIQQDRNPRGKESDQGK